MKQNIYIETKAFSPNGQTNKVAVARIEKTKQELNLQFTDGGTAVGNLPVLLIDRDSQQLGRDGPPGRARSPGAHLMQGGPTEFFPPINTTIIQPNIYKTKFQSFTTIKFSIMKKQILFLVVALFAIGVSKSYGQITPTPVDITCLPNDALHPIPGKPYDYTVIVPDPVGTGSTAWTAKTYTWFVTQETAFIRLGTNGLPVIKYTTAATDNAEPETGSDLMFMDATNQAFYADPTNGSATIKITWKSFNYDPTKPIFVVINVDGDNGICTNINNLKVFKIEPKFAFTLDIDNLTKLGVSATPTVFGDNLDNCISPIMSAVYKPGAATTDQGTVEYDFGADTLYYEVIAANWFDRWELSVRLAGLAATQTSKIDWAYTPTGVGARPINFKTAIPTADWFAVAPVSSGNGDFTSTTLVAPQTVGATAVDEKGESIIIRLVVDHGTDYEGIVDEPITLAVDGILYHAAAATPTVFDVKGPATQGDIHFAAGTSPVVPCPWYDLFANDVATQTIKARPNVTAPTPGTMPTPGIIPID